MDQKTKQLEEVFNRVGEKLAPTKSSLPQKLATLVSKKRNSIIENNSGSISIGSIDQSKHVHVLHSDPRLHAPKISNSQGQELKSLVSQLCTLAKLPSYEVWDQLNDHCCAINIPDTARYKNILETDFYKAKAFLLEQLLTAGEEKS
ncbi:hypothetical protein [Agarivorans gilvus]|uniref:Uncharacterized protein n=1 Tax=Agarivorans gilvus TaxID=680279 RepID=A0ABQ1HX55_9ALTE|nr:hypothetical protein [Agarivorans gilvus]GGA95911.1 hypothetical protein GCM10007414_05960 [Agarivorans gilvus]